MIFQTMEIDRIKTAFENSFKRFEGYLMTQKWPNRNVEPQQRPNAELNEYATEYLLDYQLNVINKAANKMNDMVFRSEMKRIKRMFSIDGFVHVYETTERKTGLPGKPIVCRYNYEQLLKDLEIGEISVGLTYNGLDFAALIYSETLRYEWLLSQTDLDVLPTPKRLIWNGQTNSLGDVFYQLKHLLNENGLNLLDATNEELAQFLQNNFERCKNTKLGTLQNLFEDASKRTSKKSKDKITIKRGGE